MVSLTGISSIEENLSPDAYQKIKNSYFEIFDNVSIHAETPEPIYTCGQYFPQRKEFKFSLVDVGVGFYKKINERNPTITTDLAAIDWAIKGNSTKKEAKGGSGLKNIMTYCMKNNAHFHIATGKCYWIFNGTSISNHSIPNPFKGTTIHLVFRY